MAAKADGTVAVGVWDVNTDSNWWRNPANAAAATYQASSDIQCDGRKQPGNVLRAPVPPGAKFPAGAGLGPAAAIPWVNIFSGPKGSMGTTRALASSAVNPKAWFKRFTWKGVVEALAVPAAGGTAVAISEQGDPWKLRFSSTKNRRHHHLAAVVVEFGGRLSLSRSSGSKRAIIGMAGSMGSLSATMNSRSKPTFSVAVVLKPGWSVYLDVRLTGKRKRIPRAATPKRVAAALRALLAPTSGGSRSTRGRRLKLVFTKDLGMAAGVNSIDLGLQALDEGALPVRG